MVLFLVGNPFEILGCLGETESFGRSCCCRCEYMSEYVSVLRSENFLLGVLRVLFPNGMLGLEESGDKLVDT